MKDCLAFLFIRFLFSRCYFGFGVFKGLLHEQCMWVVLLGEVSFGNSTSRSLFSPSGWAGSIGMDTFSGLIASNKRRSSEAFHFWTIKRGLVIKSTALMWVKWSGTQIEFAFVENSQVARLRFFLFLFVTLLQQNSFHLNSFLTLQDFEKLFATLF